MRDCEIVRHGYHQFSTARWFFWGLVLGTGLLTSADVSSFCEEVPDNTMNPTGIVIHHSALSAADIAEFPGPTDASVIDALHERRGFAITCGGRRYHIGYHYVILPNGRIQRGRPENCVGAHVPAHNNTLGICLVGNFSMRANPSGRLGNERPTNAQIHSLVVLVRKLRKKYHIPCDQVLRHQDLNPRTLCPGDRFPWADARAEMGCSTGR
jgi:hypothetical protein